MSAASQRVFFFNFFLSIKNHHGAVVFLIDLPHDRQSSPWITGRNPIRSKAWGTRRRRTTAADSATWQRKWRFFSFCFYAFCPRDRTHLERIHYRVYLHGTRTYAYPCRVSNRGKNRPPTTIFIGFLCGGGTGNSSPYLFGSEKVNHLSYHAHRCRRTTSVQPCKSVCSDVW